MNALTCLHRLTHALRTVALVGFLFPLGVYAQDLDAPAPPFTAQTMSGEAVTLTDYQGKIVLLDFWASWCGPCRKEMPFLVELYAEYQEAPFEILAVNIDEDPVNRDGFLESLGVNVPFAIINDTDAVLPPLYDLAAMPTSVFIDHEGFIRFRHTGFGESDRDLYREELEALLDELHAQNQSP